MKNILFKWEYFFYIFLLLIGYQLTHFVEPGPDALLYIQMSLNIKSGLGLIDNIRFQEIIPPLGHPLLLSFFNAKTWTYYSFFSVLIIMLLLFRKVFRNYLLEGLFFLLFILATQEWIIGNVEITLVLFFSVFITLSVYWQQSLVAKPDPVKAIILGMVLFYINLIRPLLLPWFLVFTLCSIVYLIFNRSPRIINHFIQCLTVLFLLVITHFYSHHKYQDSRVLFGTYSAIPLYSANNKFINLSSEYNSQAWNHLEEPTKSKALEPMKLKTDWKSRDQEIKKEVFKFIQQNPFEFFKSYLWRFKMFLFSGGNLFYQLLFLILIISIIKSNDLGLLKFDNPFYIYLSLLMTQSFFVYAGSRYLTTNTLLMIYSIIYFFPKMKLNSMKRFSYE